MKKLLTIALLSGTVLSSIIFAAQTSPQGQTLGAAPAQRAGSRAGQDQGSPAAKKLTRAELDALLKDPGGVLLLDVRRPDELQSVGGFPVYLSIQAADVEKYLAFVPKDRSIVTVSNHANRAQRAAALLEKNGFKVVGAIGAQDYEGEGGALVKITAPAPRSAGAPSAAAPTAAR